MRHHLTSIATFSFLHKSRTLHCSQRQSIGQLQRNFMASLNRPMMPYSYSHYPSSSSVQHPGRSVPDDGPGSFGPVLVVMAVISFLAVAACVAGRLCGRASPMPSRGNSSGQQSAEADKGAAKHLEVMRPLPSSRATVHDVDDALEIRMVPQKPGAGSMQALPLPPRQLGAPRQCPAAAAAVVGARQVHPLYGRGASSFAPAQQRR